MLGFLTDFKLAASFSVSMAAKGGHSAAFISRLSEKAPNIEGSCGSGPKTTGAFYLRMWLLGSEFKGERSV